MSHELQQFLLLAFGFIWIGVGMTLLFRFRGEQNAYLKQFEHQIEFSLGDPFFQPRNLGAFNDIRHAMREPQPDPALEHLRHEVWKQFRIYLFWIFGFPIAGLIAVVSLVLVSRLF